MRRAAIILVACLGCDTRGGGEPDAAAGDAQDAPEVPDAQPPPVPDLARFVNPFIGTLGHGNAIPGPCVPHGMVKLSPDSYQPEESVDSYEYAAPRLSGFSHTHLEGPGGSANGYSQVLVVPQVGALGVRPEDRASRFSHDDEVAEPGYYAVTLSDPGVRAELTATAACGVHRYTFPTGAAGRILIDLGHTRGMPLAAEISVLDGDIVEGRGVHQVNPFVAAGVEKSFEGPTGVSTVYVSARFSRPAASRGTWDDLGVHAGSDEGQGTTAGAFLEWDAAGIVEVRVGVSFLSVEQARANRESQCEGRSFEEVRASARDAWNRLLAHVRVEGGTDSDRALFYTALVRSLLQPADYTEDGRFFSGADGTGRTHDAGGRRFYTDDWCVWDTFRTTHPLLTLVEPEVVSDMVQSLVWLAQEGGYMPKCPWNALGDSRVMTGNPQFCVVADALAKGHDDFDQGAAWDALYRGSMEDEDPLAGTGLCGYLNRGTPKEYVEKGYVSRECDKDQSASLTLEHAYADWCVAVVADLQGRASDRDFFLARSGNYRNIFNTKYNLMQQKDAAGEFVEPFDPTTWGYGFTEASAWEYTFFVPHDLCGLAALMGGRDALVARLDEFFERGLFRADNEPDFQVPWLYAALGVPWKAQALVPDLIDRAFSDGPDGLPGNDDAGATSAWLVFAMMGLYPVSPGDGIYWLSSPLFERVVLDLTPHGRPGETFEIEAPGASRAYRFIQSATWHKSPRRSAEPLARPPRRFALGDGASLAEPRLRHEDILSGGRLVLTMGPKPSSWGAFSPCQPR